jgi:hypothetical protein
MRPVELSSPDRDATIVTDGVATRLGCLTVEVCA